MSKLASNPTATIAKMLRREHTIVTNMDDLGDAVHVGYDTDHYPPRYFFVFDEVRGIRRFGSPRDAARAFVAQVGNATAARAAREAQSEARGYARLKRGLRP